MRSGCYERVDCSWFASEHPGSACRVFAPLGCSGWQANIFNPSTVSVKIVGTLCCLLTLPMLVCKIWSLDCDKQHWEDEETGPK